MFKQKLKTGLLAALLGVSAPAMAFDDIILEFDTMVAVDGAFLGAANPIRGVNGGGLPWVLDRAKGKLDASGRLDVQVKGLIIPARGGLPDINPAPFFRAVVSCVTVENGGQTVVNATTDNGAEVMIGDPQKGDAKIKATVELPSPCLAPVLFVTSPGGAWFAVTGAGSLAP